MPVSTATTQKVNTFVFKTNKCETVQIRPTSKEGGHLDTGCNVNLVDGLVWSQEAGGSNLLTPTNFRGEDEESTNHYPRRIE